MREHLDANSRLDELSKDHPLPYIALTLTFIVPISSYFLTAIVNGAAAKNVFLAVTMLSPIAGVPTAIAALCLGKTRIGALGIKSSIIVINVTLFVIAVIVALLYRVTNGTLLFHM